MSASVIVKSNGVATSPPQHGDFTFVVVGGISAARHGSNDALQWENSSASVNI